MLLRKPLRYLSLVKSLFKWIVLLYRVGGSWSYLSILLNAWYNNKIWHPEGEWPYGMKLKYPPHIYTPSKQKHTRSSDGR